MNKIFKVIFNKSIGKLVVASELSKSNGKSSSSTDERVGVSSLMTKLQHQAKTVLVLGLLSVSSAAMGAAVTQGTGASAHEKGVAIGDQFVH